jgi:predicted permease
VNEPDWPRNRAVRVSRLLLRFAASRLPFYRRAEWLAEWEGELWAMHRDGERAAAVLRFGLGGLSESLWERRREDGRMGGLGQDIRYALRRLGRTPAFTILAILLLGIGIGANASLFTALNAVLLSRPPYPDAERIVSVDLLLEQRAGAPLDTLVWSYPKFEMARTSLGTIRDLAGYSPRTITMAGVDGAERIGVEFVTPSYFSLLGTRPVAGRVFGSGEEFPAPGAAVFLSHGFWTTNFGSDPAIVGQLVTVDGTALEVVGIGPRGFRGVSGAADAFIPVAGLATMRGARRVTNPWSHWLQGVGRLGAGVTIEEARAEAASLGLTLTETYPDPSGGGRHGVAVVPFLSARVNPVARLSVIAVSAAGLILLLIACANVAGLLLSRAAGRRTDVAVRAALGAGRARLTREFLFEGMILALSGGLLGLLFTGLGTQVVARAVRYALDTAGTRSIQFLEPASMGVDGAVVAMGIALALLTGLVFGLVPARSATRPDLTNDLRAGGRAVGGRLRDRLEAGRNLLVAGQLALTLILLAGTGLLAASYAGLAGIDRGFANEDVLTIRYERAPGQDPGDDLNFEHEFIERIQALPGVLDVAVAPCPPLAGQCEVRGLRRVDDGPVIDYGDMEGILNYSVSDDYFTTIGVVVREGRVFGPDDVLNGVPAAIVNRAAASKYFPGQSALGHRLAVTDALTENQMAVIFGVVDDVRYAGLEEEAMPAVYFSRRQAPVSYGTLFVRTVGDPLGFVSAVRREAALLDNDMPLYDVTTLGELNALATARTRIVLGLFSAFALTGLLLAALGLYAVVSYAVIRRTREMGLRVALGAAGRDVMRLVIAPPVLLTIAGATIGIVSTVLLTPFVAALLYGVEPSDPRAIAGATVVLLIVAIAAALFPAWRATRVDPAVALRVD